MQINSQELYSFLTTARLQKTGLKNFGMVTFRARKFYCQPMNASRKCTQNCQNCKLALIRSVDKIPENIQSPYGMLVYNLRNEVANQVEVEHTATVRTVDTFGTPDTSNVFDALLGGL